LNSTVQINVFCMGRIYRIYALIDPRDEQVKYIGCSRDLLRKRRDKHIGFAKKFFQEKWDGERNEWIRDLVDEDLRPEIKCLKETNEEEKDHWERYYISIYKKKGFLFNKTKGGQKLFGKDNPFYKKKHNKKTLEVITKKSRIFHSSLAGEKHKEWLRNVASRTFLIEEPSGIKKTIKNLKEYCRQEGLNYNSLHNKMRKSDEPYKGYTVKRI